MRLRHFLCILLLLVLAGCGKPSKAEILKKAEGAGTKAALEEALGLPDDVSKLGFIEQWTYNAGDGSVTFIITGDTVTLEITGGE